MVKTDLKETLATLRDDGDTADLEDGRTLRLRIEPDEDYSINDYDSDGKVAWGIRDDMGGRRPDGFDGSAEKLGIYDHGSALWWQPYKPDVLALKKSDPDAFRKERLRIRDLVEYGFKGIILELCQGEDAYGKPIVIKSASTWGVDELYPELLEDLAGELEL
jgi:hypothetical protein